MKDNYAATCSTAELMARGRFSDLVNAQYNHFGLDRGKQRGRTPLVQETVLLAVRVFEDDFLQLDALAGTPIGGGVRRSAATRLCLDLVWRLIRQHTPEGGSIVEGFIAAHNALTKGI